MEKAFESRTTKPQAGGKVINRWDGRRVGV